MAQEANQENITAYSDDLPDRTDRLFLMQIANKPTNRACWLPGSESPDEGSEENA